MQRWTCSEITRLAVTMGLLCCFVTTMSETFLATPPEVLVSQPLFLRRRTKLLGRGQNQATSLFSNIIGALRAQLLTSLSLILCRKNFLKLRRGRLAWWHRMLTTRSC